MFVMKRIFVTYLSFFALTCHASWQLIDRTPNYELYIKSNSMTKTASGYRFTWMYNYYKQYRAGKRRTGYYYFQSYVYDSEINCRTKESRGFSSAPHSFSMGRGQIRFNTLDAKWRSLEGEFAGTGLKTLYNHICR